MEKVDNYFSKRNLTNYDYDAIKYGFKVILFNFFTVFIFFIITLIYEEFAFGISFIITFFLFRFRFGGYHCKTPIGCITLMTTIYMFILYIKNDIPLHFAIFLSLISISYTLIKFMKSVDSFQVKLLMYLYPILMVILSILCFNMFLGSLIALLLFNISK